MVSSESATAAKSRSVLRRFSHFLRLADGLREELGPRALSGGGKEPPARLALANVSYNVNRRPELVEGRRRALEQWLWRLVSDPDIARSRVLNRFLELSVAAKVRDCDKKHESHDGFKPKYTSSGF